VLKPGGYQTSFYLLAGLPERPMPTTCSTTSWGCRDDPKVARGEANLGGYCNKKLDDLATSADRAGHGERDQLIKQAFEIAAKDSHTSRCISRRWPGRLQKVKLTQRADNAVLLYWATKQDKRLRHRVPAAASFRTFAFQTTATASEK